MSFKPGSIKKLFKWAENAAAVGALAFWIGRAVYNTDYGMAVLSIPIGVILKVLLDIQGQIHRELPTRRVHNFGETQSFIREAFDRLVKKRKPIEIRILGQTLQSYIAFLKPALTELLQQNRTLHLHLRIAMINPDMAHLAPGLGDAARGSARELLDFRNEWVAVNPHFGLELYQYDTPPAITGIAINDSYLFLGMIRYEPKTEKSSAPVMATTTGGVVGSQYEMVRAAGGSYDIYRDSQPEDEERITLFSNSFDALCLRSQSVV